MTTKAQDQQRRWREANADHCKAKSLAYYAANRERLVAKQRAYYEATGRQLAKDKRLADPEAAKIRYRNNHAKYREKRNARSRQRWLLVKEDPEAIAANRAHGREAYRRNPERMKAYQRYYAKAFPEKVKAQKRAYYLKNKARISKYAADRYAANPESAKVRIAEWQKNNPDRVRASMAIAKTNRRMREKTPHEEATKIKRIISREHRRKRHVCYWCKSRFIGAFHADHILALALGGTNTADNICISCPTCNYRKGPKPLTQLHFLNQQILPL